MDHNLYSGYVVALRYEQIAKHIQHQKVRMSLV